MIESMSKSDAARGGLPRRLAVLFGLGVAVNYLWELAQAPLYAGQEDFGRMWWHCFVAALGDGMLVLLIYGAGIAVAGGPGWYERPNTLGYTVMLATGLTVGIVVEWIAVHRLGRWAYTERMPLIPALDVAVLPVAQMLTLPPLVFWLSSRLGDSVRPS